MKYDWSTPLRSVAVWLVILVTAIAIIKLTIAFSASVTAATSFANRDPTACMNVDDDVARLACYDTSLDRTPSNPARGAVIPRL